MAVPPHSHPHPPPHSHHHHPPHHPAPKPVRATRVWVMVVALVAVGIAIAALKGGGGHKSTAPQDVLIDQMHQAAAGTVVSPHAFGGVLRAEKSNGRVNVTAEGLPSSACVEAGWQLAREGTVIVNGVLPQRISAARLSELCNLAPKGATLIWAPND
jgi:hypothetical protein